MIFFNLLVLSDAMESYDTGGDADYGDDDNDDYDDRVSLFSISCFYYRVDTQ